MSYTYRITFLRYLQLNIDVFNLNECCLKTVVGTENFHILNVQALQVQTILVHLQLFASSNRL